MIYVTFGINIYTNIYMDMMQLEARAIINSYCKYIELTNKK